MKNYIIRRLLQLIPVLLGISIAIFAVLRLIPGGFASGMLGIDATPELIEQVNARYGLDQPVVTQYLKWIGGVLHGDFGQSFRSGADIPAALSGTLNFVIRNGELDAKKPGPMSRFSSLSASGALSKGILTTRDLNLSGGLSVRGQGSINLINKTLNYALNVTGPGIPEIPVRYYGSLDAPQRSFNATGILANIFNSIGSGVLNILDIVVSAPLRLLAP